MQHEQPRQTRRTPRGFRWLESVWRDARVAARGDLRIAQLSVLQLVLQLEAPEVIVDALGGSPPDSRRASPKAHHRSGLVDRLRGIPWRIDASTAEDEDLS